MKSFLSIVLSVVGISCALTTAVSIQPPLIKQQTDGLIVLNPEAAAFVMRDKTGRHVKNGTDPQLKLENGRLTRIGEDFQFPGWRIEIANGGKFEVYMEVGTQRSEDCEMRINFIKDEKEMRLVAPVLAKGNDNEFVYMGEVVLPQGENEVLVAAWSADNYQRLPEIGNVVLVPVLAESAQSISRLISKSPFSKNQETTELGRSLKELNEEIKTLRANWNPKPQPAKFQDYDEFVRWEQDGVRLARLQMEVDQTSKKLRQVQLDGVVAGKEQLSVEDRALLDGYLHRGRGLKERIATIAKPTFDAKPPLEAPPLYPVGGLDKFKPMEILDKVAVTAFQVSASPDAAARQKAFAERNSPAGIEAVCRRLHSALLPGVQGLEEFYAAFDAGRFSDALDAYRDYFFRKLKAPEKFGASNVKFVDDFFQSNGKAGILRAPQMDWLAENLAGTAVYFENGALWKVHLGEPGTVDWAPESLCPPEGVAFERGPDNNPFWKTEPGKLLSRKITFFRALNRHPGQGGASAMFPDLLFSYCFTGNVDHLKRYAAYFDDWALNSAKDLDNCPVNVRAATELQVIGWYRTLLRIILDERPEFAKDYPSASLARMLMSLTEYYHPYVIRAKRAELANWGIMGVDAALNDSKLFREFRAMDYTNRELSRLARMNWIQHTSLDGEGLEAWDEGHTAIDHILNRSPLISIHGSPVMGKMEADSILDSAKVQERCLMTHCSPDGNLWVPWLSEDDSARATIRGKITSRSLIGDILDEPEVRSRFAAILGRTQTKKTPPLSDIQPYSSLIYMRDGFGKDCSSLMLLNFPVRSQTQGWGYNMKRGHIVGCMRTGFNVARDAKSVLEGSSILVDSKPPNIFVDLTPSGGKTDYCFQTPRNVQPGRFLSADLFDVSESIQDSPYRRFQFGFNREMLGLDQTTPDTAIRDVRAFRQVFHLKNESIFIVGDRIENKGGERDFAQMYIVPLRVLAPYETDRLRLLANKEGPLLEIAPEAKRIRSLSPGLPNVSLYLAGHNFEWGGRCTGEKTFEPVSSITAKALYEKVLNAGAEKEQKKILDTSRVKPVSVRWRGEGNQALAAVVVTRPTQFDPALVGNKDISDFREMNGQNGIVGFSFRSSAGTEVWFQTAPALASRLAAGPGQIVGGTLLVTRRDGQLAGVVMDAESINLNGKEYKGLSSAFEFTLDKNGPIHFQNRCTLPHL